MLKTTLNSGFIPQNKFILNELLYLYLHKTNNFCNQVKVKIIKLAAEVHKKGGITL